MGTQLQDHVDRFLILEDIRELHDVGVVNAFVNLYFRNQLPIAKCLLFAWPCSWSGSFYQPP